MRLACSTTSRCSIERISLASDFDEERWCSWTVERTSGEFANFAVQVVRLTEHYPKRSRNREVVTWIVTTNLGLSCSEIREAARLLHHGASVRCCPHRRWHGYWRRAANGGIPSARGQPRTHRLFTLSPTQLCLSAKWSQRDTAGARLPMPLIGRWGTSVIDNSIFNIDRLARCEYNPSRQ